VTIAIRAPEAWLGPGRLIEDAEVVCDGGEILRAGSRGESGEHDEVLEVGGFLMAAVADRHVHIELSDPASVLLRGVTAVRDLAWPPERIFPLADASELPSYTGPLVRAAGPMLTAPGGYPTRDAWAPKGTGRELDGPDEARVVVKELAGFGAAAIKVSLNAEAGPTISDAALAAVCEEAHDQGLPVTAHAQGRGQVERGLGAGIDELAHTPWTERLSDDVIQTCAKRMRIVSTLDILSRGRDTPEIRTALDNLRRFHTAGGTVIYGTDLGNGSVPPGIHTREAMLMAEAGLEYEEVLEAMVRAPLEPGAPADLVAFAANPLDDLAAFDDLVLVVRAGRVALAR
jgi:imidazolonepropionase-like amidohydrolase